MFLIENECNTPIQGVLHSFFIKNIFYDKMNFRLFYFHVTNFLIYLVNNKSFGHGT